MNKLVLISFISALVFSSYFIINQNQKQDETLRHIKHHDIASNSESLNIILTGDTGEPGYIQTKVGEKMNEIGKEQGSQFILGLGDNFYPSGVNSVDDPIWNTNWADCYQSQDYLKNLNWYNTIGNHDFGGDDVYAEIKYNNYGWIIEDFFWSHTAEINGKSIAFIHIDTNFLAYGKEGDSINPNMQYYFIELGWKSNEQMLQLVRQQLEQFRNYDWKFVMAHHPIGFSCDADRDTPLLYPLLEEFKVDAYFAGHAHSLAYDQFENMGFLISGAAAKVNDEDGCASVNPSWSIAQVMGFMTLKIHEDYMEVIAYYSGIDGEENWRQHDLPAIKRRNA